MHVVEPPQVDTWIRDVVADGATVAIGGNGLVRKPMGLVRALVRAGVRDLRLVVFLGSVDAELLLATSGAVAELHTAGVALESFGLAPRYRAAREAAGGRVVPWSEGTLHAALEGGARGLASVPTAASPRSGLVESNDHLRVIDDPFSGEAVVQARSLPVDVALLQASAVDDDGNVHVDGDLAIDDVLARAADRVIVSVAEVTEARSLADAAISRLWVDDVVVDPVGAWPTACLPSQSQDPRPIQTWARSKGEDATVLLEREEA